jgi:hypothetical protein
MNGHAHDATALAAEVRAGRVTPRELAEQAAEGVARLNPKVKGGHRSFADTLANPDTDHPNKEGALYGVPMFLKDLGSGLKGRTQDSGSGLLRGTVLKATDPVIENFLHAGLVPLGRSSSPPQQNTRQCPVSRERDGPSAFAARNNRRRYGETERCGVLQIDHQLERGRLLDRQIGGLLALKDPSGALATRTASLLPSAH